MALEKGLRVTWWDAEQMARTADLSRELPGWKTAEPAPADDAWAERIARDGFWIGPAMFVAPGAVLYVQVMNFVKE